MREILWMAFFTILLATFITLGACSFSMVCLETTYRIVVEN